MQNNERKNEKENKCERGNQQKINEHSNFPQQQQQQLLRQKQQQQQTPSKSKEHKIAANLLWLKIFINTLSLPPSYSFSSYLYNAKSRHNIVEKQHHAQVAKNHTIKKTKIKRCIRIVWETASESERGRAKVWINGKIIQYIIYYWFVKF